MFEIIPGAPDPADASARCMTSANSAAMVMGASGTPTAPAAARDTSGSTNANASTAFSNGRKPCSSPSRNSQASGIAIRVRS